MRDPFGSRLRILLPAGGCGAGVYSPVLTGAACLFLFSHFRRALFYGELYFDPGAVGAVCEADGKVDGLSLRSAGGRQSDRSWDTDPLRVQVPASLCGWLCSRRLSDAVPACDMENDRDSVYHPDPGLCTPDRCKKT